MHRPSFSIPAGLPLLLCFACPGTDDGDAETAAAATEASASSDTPTTSSPSGAPVVMELLANTAMITESEPITFTAIVVDPDGLDTIVGGKLTTEDGSGFYGAFAHIGGGTFQIVLTFELIGQSSKIEFVGPEQVRVFKADFVDVDGNHGTATIEIKLSCASKAACASKCVYLNEDNDNCGKCGGFCDPDSYLKCKDGECAYY